jgi:hypothetical protein
MIAQVLLLAGLAVCLAIAYARRGQARLLSWAMTFTSLFGMYVVLFPDQTNIVARWVGIGRGADLITYCWILISLIVALDLRFRIVELQRTVTKLTRFIALREAESSCDGPPS